MPKFDAATVCEGLDWDFSHFDAGEGTIPEPSDAKIATFFKELGALTKELIAKAEIPDNPSAQDVLLALADLPEGESFLEMVQETAKIYAKLCSNKPSAAQLSKLPMRVRFRFYAWLRGELGPEAASVDSTRPNLSIVRNA